MPYVGLTQPDLGGRRSQEPRAGWPHRSTRKPGYRVMRWRRRWPRQHWCWLRQRRCYLDEWLRWRSYHEQNFYRIWFQDRWWSFREEGMLCWRLIDADQNCLRHESVLCKDHRLAFDRQCKGARCLARQTLHGAHIGAGWFRLELYGLWRRRRHPLLRQIELQCRASRERIAHRGRDSGEDEPNARHDRLESPKGRLGWRLRVAVHRRRDCTLSGLSMVNA